MLQGVWLPQYHKSTLKWSHYGPPALHLNNNTFYAFDMVYKSSDGRDDDPVPSSCE
jgi:hypothetical protein